MFVLACSFQFHQTTAAITQSTSRPAALTSSQNPFGNSRQGLQPRGPWQSSTCRTAQEDHIITGAPLLRGAAAAALRASGGGGGLTLQGRSSSSSSSSRAAKALLAAAAALVLLGGLLRSGRRGGGPPPGAGASNRVVVLADTHVAGPELALFGETGVLDNTAITRTQQRLYRAIRAINAIQPPPQVGTPVRRRAAAQVGCLLPAPCALHPGVAGHHAAPPFSCLPPAHSWRCLAAMWCTRGCATWQSWGSMPPAWPRWRRSPQTASKSRRRYWGSCACRGCMSGEGGEGMDGGGAPACRGAHAPQRGSRQAPRLHPLVRRGNHDGLLTCGDPAASASKDLTAAVLKIFFNAQACAGAR